MSPSGSGIDPVPPAPFGTARNAMLEPLKSPTSLVTTPPIPSLRASSVWLSAVVARSAHPISAIVREVTLLIGVIPRIRHGPASLAAPWARAFIGKSQGLLERRRAAHHSRPRTHRTGRAVRRLTRLRWKAARLTVPRACDSLHSLGIAELRTPKRSPGNPSIRTRGYQSQ